MIRRSFSKHDVRCAAEGCGEIVGTGRIFCLGHYRSLPKKLRDELWATWRAAMDARKGRTKLDDQLRINREYQEAYQACWDYLSKQSVPAHVVPRYASGYIKGGADASFRFRARNGGQA